MGEMRTAYTMLVGEPERKGPLRRSSIDEKIILERILGK
jgi:hypothetical protein